MAGKAVPAAKLQRFLLSRFKLKISGRNKLLGGPKKEKGGINLVGVVGLALEAIGRPVLYFLLYLGYFSAASFLKARALTRKVGKLLRRPARRIIVYPPPRLKLPRLTLKRFLAFSILLFLASGTATFYFTILSDLPNAEQLTARPQPLTTKIYDRRENLLFKFFRRENRTPVTLSQIPLPLQQATIAIEDSDFYQHRGVSLRGITRALLKTTLTGRLEGGSTITQQLVKNALLSPERTLSRKLKEAVLAFRVENRFSKDEILEMYLNEVGFGGAAYGVEEATQTYFGKTVSQLTLAESALLAGLSAAPTRFSPYGAHPELARERQIEVLRRMVEDGYITPEQAEAARNEKITLQPQRIDIQAPHFVMYVKEILVERYGERLVEEGGLEVTTSLDLEVQEKAQEIVKNEVAALTSLGVGNGAALVTRPATGEILAMVGSRNYFDVANDGAVNVTTRPRQPGSAIKPVNYAVALDSGYTAATVLADTSITFQIPGQPPYSPKNYDGQFHGAIPLRVALGSSYNVPAVKVLASYGVPKMIEAGQKLGITTWEDESRFGLSLTLGGGEVKMTDLSVVYGVLANQGLRVNLQPILRVSDSQGKVLEKLNCEGILTDQKSFLSRLFAAWAAPPTCNGNPVVSPQIAYILTDILKDNQARTPAFGPNSLLVLPSHEVAVKTGTSNNLRDNWAVGFTPSFLVAAWVGNNDNRPMAWVASGVTGATPIWHKIMRQVLEGRENESFGRPEGLVEVSICTLTGELACTGCPTRAEIFIDGTQPKKACQFEEVVKEVEEETRGQTLSAEEKRGRVLEKLEKRKRD